MDRNLKKKIWLAPTHPNSLLWSASVALDPERLLGSMTLLRSLWRKLSRAHGLSFKNLLLTSFLYNLEMHAGLTRQMSLPWATRNLFRFGHLVDPRSCKLLLFTELQRKMTYPTRYFVVICKYGTMLNLLPPISNSQRHPPSRAL